MSDLINGRTPEAIKRWISSLITCNTCSKEHETGCEYGERTEDCQMCIDTLAYIERLEAQQPKWISVEEKLPRKGQSVYILIRGRVSYPAKFYSEEEKLFAAFTGDGFFMVGCDRDGGVTHWAPLPEPTKEEG